MPVSYTNFEKYPYRNSPPTPSPYFVYIVLGRQNKIWTFGNPFQSKSCQFAPRIVIFNLCICCQFEDLQIISPKIIPYEPSQHLTVTNEGSFFCRKYFSFFGTLFRIVRKRYQELLYRTTFWYGLVFNGLKDTFRIHIYIFIMFFKFEFKFIYFPLIKTISIYTKRV